MAQTPACWVEARILKDFGDSFIIANWHVIIEASHMIEWDWGGECHHLYSRLFGVWAPGPRIQFDKVAPDTTANRGLPKDLSTGLEFTIDGFSRDRDGTDHLLGYNYTWVTWREMQLIADMPMPTGWKTLLSLMEVLADSYGDENVRLIFWIVK